MKIKNKDIRKMNKQEQENKLLELKKDLIKINAQIAAGTVPENPGNVKNVKKTVARIMTIMNEATKEEKKKTHA
ncbi:MAG: large subunit ribosomal protein L29 [archaeon GW2011_AR17]|nr:MAG: large subunit ribosomal protein L29 [archaeon GW2011_AR17]MBS3154308.1 50S ribosomal protein L29 [Candidatus Woesearchaeota archaeon]HIH15248.1 50S ribosomal protein L29 [Nanoarchaeota archaeon]HIH58599.1 50S ribosomal protein L29 [Nanoarchaeota archaeon]HII13794.1 50S ribosomal protein L29 [Nanoarchaeota archaeon]